MLTRLCKKTVSGVLTFTSERTCSDQSSQNMCFNHQFIVVINSLYVVQRRNNNIVVVKKNISACSDSYIIDLHYFPLVLHKPLI